MSHPHPTYDALTAHYTRLHHFGHLQAMAWWDQACNMPPKGQEARAAALAEVATLVHRMRTDPQLPQQFERAAQEPLDDAQRANLREMQRE